MNRLTILWEYITITFSVLYMIYKYGMRESRKRITREGELVKMAARAEMGIELAKAEVEIDRLKKSLSKRVI